MAKDKRKPPRRMFKATDRVSRYEHDRSPIGRMKRVAREHEDVLEAIESLFVSRWQENPGIDDRTAVAAIHGHITGNEPDEPLARALARDLTHERAAFPDLPDSAWHAALRVVRDSVHRHSGCQPGETEYLSFVSDFVEPTD
jgi:hypothetical protein